MSSHTPRPSWGASQHVTGRVIQTLERFLHIEAVSGGVLIVAALIALLWANSPLAASYHALWHLPVTLGIGSLSLTQSLHFIVNDGLMTIFFLVAGLEIRREIHEGSLATLRQATLPLAAAIGGVIMPALIYLSLNIHYDTRSGWAVPIATDIAFALGVLALLGKSIPGEVRALLLALAIVDDVIAILVIALVYSHGLQLDGALLAALAIGIVLLMQRLGIRAAVAYVLPGLLLWGGLLRLGVHPTLAGVVLGLLTPVVSLAAPAHGLHLKNRLQLLTQHTATAVADDMQLVGTLKQVHAVQRELIPPVVSVQTALHPWVAYLIMPLFAFANAGVTLSGFNLDDAISRAMIYGIAFGLLIGKPLGILLASAITIRLGWALLPQSVGWRGLLLVAWLGGIGFTMSIFIATLAYDSAELLASAKLSIMLASFMAAIIALLLGKRLFATTHKTVTTSAPERQ